MKRRGVNLPNVVDCRSQDAGELAEICPGEFDWENPYAWRIEYRAVYQDGREDSRLKGRAMGGATERIAIIRLRKLLAGFGVIEIRITHVRPPATLNQIHRIKEVNEWVRQQTKRAV